MDSANFDQLVYLVVLGAAVLGWFVAESRAGLGRHLRMAMVWGLIFLGVVAAYGLWNDVRDELMPRQAVMESGAITVPRSADGQFHLVLRINGEPVRFLVDTGASDMVLTRQDAERVGLDPGTLPLIGTARTANGTVRTAHTVLDEVALGPVVHRDVPVAINESEMFGSLLGMSYLSRFDRIEISGGQLTLTP